MTNLVVIEKGRNSRGAHVPDLRGCVAVATTRAQLSKLAKEAIEVHIDGLKQAGPNVRRHSKGQLVVVSAA